VPWEASSLEGEFVFAVTARATPLAEAQRVTPGPLPAPAPPLVRIDPPKIQFSYPPAEARLDRDRTPLIALVTDAVGITAVELTVNGETVPSVTSPREPTVQVTVNTAVALQVGENVFAITATNKAGKADQIIRVVTRVAPAMLASPAPPKGLPESKGERYAVVFGVGIYDHPQIPRLRFAENDARSVYDVLTTKGGFKKDNVLLVTDTARMKPTLANIKRAVAEWLYKKTGKDDTVFVYYAGHGAPEVDGSGSARDGLSRYLLPRDADPESLFVTAFAIDDVETIFRRLHADRVMFVIDAGFNGSGVGRSFANTTRVGLRTKELLDRVGAGGTDFIDRLGRIKGRAVITAGAPNEVALELPELKHGVLTYYLLKGLEGAADADKDKVVTAQELFDYVQRNVSDRVRQERGKQSPMMSGSVGTVPLVDLRN
jgi:hypothetical protein